MKPECEVEFAIDLVPSTILMFMVPYRMFALQLSELKKKLEESLEKKFSISIISPSGR